MKRSESSARSMAARNSSRSGARGVAASNRGTLIALSARRERLEVCAGHQPDQFLEARLGLPAEVPARLGRVSDQVVDLGGPHERWVDSHVLLEVAEPGLVEGDLAAFADPVRRARR